MLSVANKIMNKVRGHGRGHVFTPRDFIFAGSREAVDTALSRLVAQKSLKRLSRGLYAYPKKHRLLGDLLPSMDNVAKAIAKDTDSQIQISGARALYLLGLTTQVPAQTVYLTNGASREIVLGNTTLIFKHAKPRIMAGAGSKAGTVLQAIRYLGKNNLTEDVLQKIARQLSVFDKQQLKGLTRHAPAWTRASIDRLVFDGSA